MTPEVEIITPNLRGACMTIDNQLHGLFKVNNRCGTAAESAWSKVRAERRTEGFPGKRQGSGE